MSQARLWSRHLVAHRGESADYPENTLSAMQAALAAGVKFLECDIQLSRDGQAMVVHDSRMGRTTSVKEGRVWDYSAAQLKTISAGYTERFNNKFLNECVPGLDALVDLVKQWPDAHIFVELKRASLEHFGYKSMFDAVLPVLEEIAGRYSLISYNDDALMQLRTQYQQPIGWVSDRVDDKVIARARQLQCDFLITDADTFQRDFLKIKPTWRWMLFEVNQPEVAQSWLSAGVDYIETNRVKNYLF